MKITKTPLIIPLVVAALVALGLGFYLGRNYNPLEKYGVSYVTESGENKSAQRLDWYWKQNGKNIEGPRIFGDWLRVSYKYADKQKDPDIVVYEAGDKTHFVVLKLNFTDPHKPEFELMELHGLAIDYLPPWGDYYKRNPETEMLDPVHEDAKN